VEEALQMSDACTRKWTESTSEERVQNFCVGQEYSRTAPALHFSSVKRKKEEQVKDQLH